MLNIQEAIEKYNKGEVSIEDLSKIVQENGQQIVFWNPASERNPKYLEGDNSSRDGFIYNPYHHVRGKFFQDVIKKAILKAIDFAHSAMVKHYDQDAYRYDDLRLAELEKFTKEYIRANFHDSYPYKHDFMMKLVDVVLGLAKEDIYYRARMLDFIQKFRRGFPEMAISPTENDNIERWH
ncbi:hypothetical protein ANME2D_02324 [Candidatus Methanoperedens nitroreducens]|uniref:Uncharacterized protein n=1 Tax=Candidatus Methanoperedens nitratireducens TaxID=1392998 RepID=A0A062V735_9EURY|nr:hypothetical protein ANME2D_02324 [Candidatus Methanoperedens nitroreducens]